MPDNHSIETCSKGAIDEYFFIHTFFIIYISVVWNSHVHLLGCIKVHARFVIII